MQEVARRPGVSAEDVESVLRVHADRVHDAVRRLGVDPQTAVEIVQRSAVSLVDAVAERPEQVPDAVGWWFAAARRLSRGAVPDAPDLPIGGGVLSADDDQLVLAETLEGLAEDERLALLLRDAYRLPMASVAASLGTDEPGATAVVARARLHAVPLLDDEPAPAVPSHADSLSALARLGEGEPVPRDATMRRHVQACTACAAVFEAQQRVHLLLSGLAVVALPEGAREGVLRGAEERARAALPTASSLVLTDDEWEEWDDERRILPPLLATLGLVIALVLGAGLGVLLSRGADGVLPAASNVLPAVTLPPVEQAPPITLSADLPPPPPIPTPRTTVFFLPPPTTPPPTTPPPPPPTATATPSTTPTTASPSPAAATLSVDPSSGPDGTTLQVTGTGWTPGARVLLEYLDQRGRPTGSRATAVVEADGTFDGQLVARDPSGVPGRHTVRASDGTRTLTAPFDATT